MTEEEYLELDRANEHRSEYIDGEMIAIRPSSLGRSTITSNCICAFYDKLRETDCSVLACSMRVFVSFSRSYVYPDMSVVCGLPVVVPGNSDLLTNPSLIVEVLYPATCDKAKLIICSQLESLNEYLMVHIDRVCVWHYSRQADRSWKFYEYLQLETQAHIPSLNFTLPISELYAPSKLGA